MLIVKNNWAINMENVITFRKYQSENYDCEIAFVGNFVGKTDGEFEDTIYYINLVSPEQRDEAFDYILKMYKIGEKVCDLNEI